MFVWDLCVDQDEPASQFFFDLGQKKPQHHWHQQHQGSGRKRPPEWDGSFQTKQTRKHRESYLLITLLFGCNIHKKSCEILEGLNLASFLWNDIPAFSKWMFQTCSFICCRFCNYEMFFIKKTKCGQKDFHSKCFLLLTSYPMSGEKGWNRCSCK